MSSDSEGGHVDKMQSREERLRNVQRLCASIQSEQRKRTTAEGGITMATAAKKGKGQRSTYKIKLGWQNYRQGKYRVVTKAKGGETHMMPYTFGETVTVERIRNQALDYFFPDGVSSMGSVEEYDFSLALSSGKVIDSFTDKNKNPCNFSEYLRANGLYASQCHIYLRSKKKENKSFLINGFLIEKGERTIHIKYSKITQSNYSEEQSELSCQSTLRCFDVSGSPEKDTYDPFEDGFLVSRIEVQNTVFLERDGNAYNCPEASSTEQFILNGPNQIFGLEVDDSNSLVLGAITIAHNNNYIYKWLRNGNLFCSGINRCVVKVTEPGSYHVTVVNSNDSSTQGMSDIVKVEVITSAKTLTVHPGAHSQIINPVVDPQMESPAFQVANPVVDPHIAHVATHFQVPNPIADRQIADVTAHSHVINPVVELQIAHAATQSQVANPVADPQIAHVTAQSQVIDPVGEPQIAYVATHSQVANPVVDPQITHVAAHSQVSNQVVDPHIANIATNFQVTNPFVDPQTAHVATHSQVINPVADPQIAHVATHSQVANPVVDPHIAHVATHFQVTNPVADPLVAHVAANSQVTNPVGDPQIAHVATHSQVTNQVVDPQIAHVAAHYQVANPVGDPQVAHVAANSQVINPVEDPQIAHEAAHPQVFIPGTDPQIAHVTTHSQVINPVGDPQSAHVATRSQVANPVVDPRIDHEAAHSQVINQVVDPQIAHVVTHSQVASPVVDPQIARVATHSQVANPVVDPQIAHVVTHSQVANPVVDPQIAYIATHSQVINPVADPQIAHVAAHTQVINPVGEPQITHVATHSQVANPVVDPQTVHEATHFQITNPFADPQIAHVATHVQVTNSVVDPQIAHVATHYQFANQVGDPQIAHVAAHSQVINPVVDSQIAHVATHSQVINPVVDPQIAHVATHSQVANPVVDPNIAKVATHSQVANPVGDPLVAHVATNYQVANPVVDPQIAHVATHSQVANPVVDPQIAHVTTHSEVANPVVDPQIAHVTTHSEVANPVVDSHIAHVATHSHIIKPAIDPQFDHASKKSQIISPVVDPQIEHSTKLQVVRKPAERQADFNFCNSTSNLNCVPMIHLTDIAFGRELGKGGFGTVFEGEWLKSKVAVKVISVKRLKLIKYNLLREITLHSQLRHPNIVLLMAYALESSKLYLITELVEGDSLDEVLFGDKNKTLIMSERLAIAEKICLAVVYMHSQTPVVIHRDIKPENILISYDLKQVKLCDMGLSKIKTMNTVMTTMAGGLVQPGTTVYQAPEILVDRKSANIASDMWSLSCTLVELMSDCPIWSIPEDSENPVQYIMEQMNVNAKPDGFHELRFVAHTGVYCVLERGLSYKATDRPQASEIVDCLHSLILT